MRYTSRYRSSAASSRPTRRRHPATISGHLGCTARDTSGTTQAAGKLSFCLCVGPSAVLQGQLAGNGQPQLPQAGTLPLAGLGLPTDCAPQLLVDARIPSPPAAAPWQLPRRREQRPGSPAAARGGRPATPPPPGWSCPRGTPLGGRPAPQPRRPACQKGRVQQQTWEYGCKTERLFACGSTCLPAITRLLTPPWPTAHQACV
jgi:hypothetical protein